MSTDRFDKLIEAFLAIAGPGILGGVTVRTWLRALRDNNFQVSPSCVPRALTITYYSILNSLIGWCEEVRFGRDITDVEVPPPLFILGHWRQGTSHLHNLLTVDRRFAYPTTYEALFPHTFLLTEWLAPKVFGMFMPKRRPMDRMEWNMASPLEDEFAICAADLSSPCLAWAFPRRRQHYERFLTLRNVSSAERHRWCETLVWFVKKLTVKNGRPLVLKSPPHTARLRLLVELFPEARFVHIRRNPFHVFPSTRKTMLANLRLHCLQRDNWDDLDDWIFRQYRTMYDAYFEDLPGVPSERFVEVSFEDLERDPIEQIRMIYSRVGLPAFAEVEPRLRSYVASLAGYEKNRFPALPPDLEARIAIEWRRNLDVWGYQRPNDKPV